MRSGVLAAALLLSPLGAAGAAPLRFFVDPLQVGVERLDAAYVALGVDTRTAVRIGAGAGLDWRGRAQLALGASTSAGDTDFGLLVSPGVHLERRDVSCEVRFRAPWTWRGFAVQGAAGLGRLALAYHPDALVVDAGGAPETVALDAVHAWTRVLAAEVLHSIGRCDVVLRGSSRSYALELGTPEGPARRDVRDLQAGLWIRVAR